MRRGGVRRAPETPEPIGSCLSEVCEPEENKLWHRGFLREKRAMAMVVSATQVGDRPATQSNAALGVRARREATRFVLRSATPYVRADHIVEASELSPAFGFITPRFMYHTST